MESYYVTMPLPGEEEPGFGLVLPFTPLNRTNMTAWLAGQTDEAGVPRLVAYRFPPQTNVPGPEQIENRVNTDPVISERITLLDGTGSRVILGNLLVIPVGDTVLYAQPFYLRATSGRASLTEFEYVILATNGQTVMRQSLAEALSALAAGEGTVAGEAAPEAGGVPADAGTAAVSAGRQAACTPSLNAAAVPGSSVSRPGCAGRPEKRSSRDAAAARSSAAWAGESGRTGKAPVSMVSCPFRGWGRGGRRLGQRFPMANGHVRWLYRGSSRWVAAR